MALIVSQHAAYLQQANLLRCNAMLQQSKQHRAATGCSKKRDHSSSINQTSHKFLARQPYESSHQENKNHLLKRALNRRLSPPITALILIIWAVPTPPINLTQTTSYQPLYTLKPSGCENKEHMHGVIHHSGFQNLRCSQAHKTNKHPTFQPERRTHKWS